MVQVGPGKDGRLHARRWLFVAQKVPQTLPPASPNAHISENHRKILQAKKGTSVRYPAATAGRVRGSPRPWCSHPFLPAGPIGGAAHTASSCCPLPAGTVRHPSSSVVTVALLKNVCGYFVGSLSKGVCPILSDPSSQAVPCWEEPHSGPW